MIDGFGWRSGAAIEQRKISQWFFKITDYAEELLNSLDTLKNWPERVITMQRNWIGRSEGLCIDFPILHRRSGISVFTTRPDTLMGVSYVAIAIEHPIAEQAAVKNKKIAAFIQKFRKTKVSEAELATQKKEGIFSGCYAYHPITREKLPVWITNFVLIDYGSGAIMAVPAHDERDHVFALKYNLPIKPVIEPPQKKSWNFREKAYTGYGNLINSDPFNHSKSQEAFKLIADYLESKKMARKYVNYRLRDWCVSRQRYWGTPIPIIYCKRCGTVPVSEDDLPVKLPPDIIPDGQGSPLQKHVNFYNTFCPQCGGSATRETDTLDTFMESAWYYARYCSFNQNKAMLDDRAKYWTPVNQYIGGIEHAVSHLLYARFMHKLLRDEGLLNSDEPFDYLLTQGMVLKNGSKMSKSKGNVVLPQPLIKQYGVDSLRLFIMFAAPPERSLEWSNSGLAGAYRFLKKLWRFAMDVQATIQGMNNCDHNDHRCLDITTYSASPTLRKSLHETLTQANQDMVRQRFNTVVSAAMKIFNLLLKANLKIEAERYFIHEALDILLRLLAPFTPHITHTLWQSLHFKGTILDSGWPKADSQAIQSNQLEWVIQINGRVRAKTTLPAISEKSAVKNAALNEHNIKRYVADKKIKKIIVVSNQVINLINIVL